MSNAYMRFPTIFKDNIVFVAEDDLWTVSSNGGNACRLTNTPGLVTHPYFSPDGKWIAYSATDEGKMETYIMHFEGGQSRRLTYHHSRCTVVGWLPGKNRVLFRGRQQ